MLLPTLFLATSLYNLFPGTLASSPVVVPFTEEEVAKMRMPFENAYLCEIAPTKSPREFLNAMLQEVIKEQYSTTKSEAVPVITEWLNTRVINDITSGGGTLPEMAAFKLVPIIARATEAQVDALLERLGLGKNLVFRELLMLLKDKFLCGEAKTPDSSFPKAKAFFKESNLKRKADPKISAFLDKAILSEGGLFSKLLLPTINSHRLAVDKMEVKTFSIPLLKERSYSVKPIIPGATSHREKLYFWLHNAMINMIRGQNGWGPVKEALWLFMLIRDCHKFSVEELTNRWFTVLGDFAKWQCSDKDRQIFTVALFTLPFFYNADDEEVTGFFKQWSLPEGEKIESLTIALNLILQGKHESNYGVVINENLQRSEHFLKGRQIRNFLFKETVYLKGLEDIVPVSTFLKKIIPDKEASEPQPKKI